MLLSVIIVNYNVKYFLEQCLCSVGKAFSECPPGRASRTGSMVNGQWEVIVVDNNSSDGSVAYLQQKFPFVKFIVNTGNVGFARANNQALQQASGKYILFLNPDTILPEDAFTKCIAFMESQPDAGAMGVRMIDGSGKYLKESKRGFPSPWVAFCKMTGLTGLFPSSKMFAGYYLGHLAEQEQHTVDVLPGAFMLCCRETLEKTGGFDEQFFMYAEDIDLSYRIQQAGYKNYYYPDITIIHFKGESTRKDSRYIRLFYKAMIQFVRKHFRGGMAWLYTILLESAIWSKAMMAAVFQGLGKKNEKPGFTGKILIHGEKTVIEKLAVRLTGYNEITFIYTTEDMHALKAAIQETPGRTVVFCESPAFCFKKIIRLINDIHLNASFKIFASGSNSIVGSHSKSIQGDVILLK